jgi:hypothetical protein
VVVGGPRWVSHPRRCDNRPALSGKEAQQNCPIQTRDDTALWPSWRARFVPWETRNQPQEIHYSLRMVLLEPNNVLPPRCAERAAWEN